jgi:predicted dinucleotide-binding enzyme
MRIAILGGTRDIGEAIVLRLAANTAPKNVPVVGAFHNLAAGRIKSLDKETD